MVTRTPSDCLSCDGFGNIWNNADPTSGQRFDCEDCTGEPKPRIRIRADGWIRHDGGGKPDIIPAYTEVKTLWRDGTPIPHTYAYWPHIGTRSDIMFWRFA